MCWTFPRADIFPEDLWGQPFIGIAGPYVGDPDEGQQVCAPLHDLGTVLTDLSGVAPWLEAQQFFDEDYPSGRRYYWKSAHLPDITVITPVYLSLADTSPSFYVGSRGHHADIGGTTPGSMPPFSRTIADEGVLLRHIETAPRLHKHAVDNPAQ